jgi:hypothetical protein
MNRFRKRGDSEAPRPTGPGASSPARRAGRTRGSS